MNEYSQSGHSSFESGVVVLLLAAPDIAILVADDKLRWSSAEGLRSTEQHCKPAGQAGTYTQTQSQDISICSGCLEKAGSWTELKALLHLSPVM